MKDEWSAAAAAEAAVLVLEEWVPDREEAFRVLDRVLVALQDGTNVYGHRVEALRETLC